MLLRDLRFLIPITESSYAILSSRYFRTRRIPRSSTTKPTSAKANIAVRDAPPGVRRLRLDSTDFPVIFLLSDGASVNSTSVILTEPKSVEPEKSVVVMFRNTPSTCDEISFDEHSSI